MMFATPMHQQFVPFTPLRPSPLSPRRANTTTSRPMTTTTTTASSPTSPSPSQSQSQFHFQPQFQFQPKQPTDPFTLPSTSPSPSHSAFTFSPHQTPTSPSPRTSTATAPSTYAHRYATKISNPLHNQPRSYTASSTPTARSTRRNAFLNRVKRERDAGRFENRGEQLALMEHVAEEKRWGEVMRRRAERLAMGELELDYDYEGEGSGGGDVAEGEGQEVELSVEDEIALEEYLRQEDAAHMGPWGSGSGSDHAVATDPGQLGQLGQGGNNGTKDGGSFSDEEYDDIFMDLAQPPSQDMDMSG
ncbi:uncharacterized protein LDX57_004719 [Aspergillus melleus]|uniref:uncharacterized protein n=1 Tax=Aspergillus melleus TaxID=138277 RepID=UPI001E8E0FB5|nr:uncharacterized protein LDX57_004719 [Aspergillus melleus]KAH8426998.1 hypothetical protein LDX57_004719 [Aspergillus melleus]